ncbi:Cellulose synthase, partial [Cynara cardunculus var. scolymus]
MYEKMKLKVENVVERGQISAEYIANEDERKAFDKWSEGFTRHDHPTIIQVLLESGQENEIEGHPMPNLIYVSREKSKIFPHHFKAGALNALLRVSAVMTNAPIVLTQDCDMYSNDPKTPQQMLCFYVDQSMRHNLGYIQFPQRFHGINSADIYGSEYKRLYVINPGGMDGLRGPCYVGSGCFFDRRVFFGGPS